MSQPAAGVRVRWGALDRPSPVQWVLICVGLAAFALCWFVLQLVHPVGPEWLLWVTTPVYGPIVALVFRQAALSPGASETSRLFWRRMTWAPFWIGLGQCAQAVDVLRDPRPGSHTGPLMLVLEGTAIAIVIHALLRLPTGRQSNRVAVRIMLDAATVLLAAAVFIWHFSTRSALGRIPEGVDSVATLTVALALTVMAALVIFILFRVILSEHRVINPTGMGLLSGAALFGMLAPILQPALYQVDARLFSTQISIPVVFVLAGSAAALQQREVQRPERRKRLRVGGFSVLPYTAVGAVDGLLLWITWTTLDDIAVVAATAVILTAVVVYRQITALRDNAGLLAQLHHGATHDALTGLANRVLFQRRLQEALAAAPGRHLSVLLIDLDDFKKINDTLGHEVGDLLLVEVAQRFLTCAGERDTVARLGGDEFVMVLRDTDPQQADRVVDRVVEALRRPVAVDRHELAIRASIGIADGRTGDEASILLRRADIAMYAAKAAPGTAARHFREGMVTAESDHAVLATELREAIDREQLFLLYQPIVNLADGQLIGAEALVRWAHPQRGVLTPDAFLPVAERGGLIVDLGRWVIRTALDELAQWPAGCGVPPMLNINLSARDLDEPDLVDLVAELLARHGISPARITFEITETVALQGTRPLATLHRLRALGVRVSLDDFGTGYSTLSLLQNCPVDEIKLDRSFTRDAEDGSAAVAMAVIQLARALGLGAVAEGVETDRQAQRLLDYGYDSAQGYHFARPVRPEGFEELFTPETEGSMLAG